MACGCLIFLCVVGLTFWGWIIATWGLLPALGIFLILVALGGFAVGSDQS